MFVLFSLWGKNVLMVSKRGELNSDIFAWGKHCSLHLTWCKCVFDINFNSYSIFSLFWCCSGVQSLLKELAFSDLNQKYVFEYLEQVKKEWWEGGRWGVGGEWGIVTEGSVCLLSVVLIVTATLHALFHCLLFLAFDVSEVSWTSWIAQRVSVLCAAQGRNTFIFIFVPLLFCIL